MIEPFEDEFVEGGGDGERERLGVDLDSLVQARFNFDALA